MKALVLSLLGLWPALSSTISVSSTGFMLTATATLTSPGAASDSQSYSQNYVLLVTGGTGSGMAYPDFLLSGSTNESNGAWNLLGSLVEFSVTGIYDIWAGDPYGPASQATPPGYACGTQTFPSCGIPFTFGVPETIQVRASVEAMIQTGPNAPSTFSQTVSGSVAFDFDSFVVMDAQGRLFTGDPTFTTVPEPGSWALLLVAGLIVFRAHSRLLGPVAEGHLGLLVEHKRPDEAE